MISKWIYLWYCLKRLKLFAFINAIIYAKKILPKCEVRFLLLILQYYYLETFMKVKYNPDKNIFELGPVDSLMPQLMWHITDMCELDCKLCFAKKKRRRNLSTPIENIDDLLEIMQKLCVQKIDISGGEPLFHKNLVELVQKASERGFYLTITTRGIGLKENINWICNNWFLFSRIIVSIDACTYSDCVIITGSEKAFDTTIDFCNSLREIGCHTLRINTVVNKLIINRNKAEKFVNLLNKIRPKEWCIIEPHPSNKCETFDAFSVSKDEYYKFLEYVSECYLDKRITILRRTNDMYSTYWSLYPDGQLKRLSFGEEYTYNICFNNESIQEIINVLHTDHMTLP